MKNLLYNICGVTIKYANIARLSVPYVLLDASIEISDKILPYIKQHFNYTRDEKYCKILAYEIVCFLQIVFYRAKDFQRYSGVNIYSADELKDLIDNQVDIL